MRKYLIVAAAVLAGSNVSAQILPFLSKYPTTPPPAQPVQNPIEALRSEFALQSGGTTVYFATGSAQLTPQAMALLTAQAAWLRQHPEIPVRIEGHGDPTDMRDHALALGARRAEEARDYLILLGLPSAQVSAMTWGKERPGPPSAVTTLRP